MLLFQSSCLLLMAVHNGDLLNSVASRKEEVQPVQELFTILQVDLPVKIEIISNRSRYESFFRNVHEKPKTPTEKKESIMLKEAKARYC